MHFKHHRHHHPGLEHTISENELSLGQLPSGVTAQVVRVTGGNGLVNRIACLGFTPGAEVTLLQNYGRGPLIACVRGTRLALGRGEAEQILVKITKNDIADPG
jgi:ferrous iron transport protein A